MVAPDLHIYVHVPFCTKKCKYCDFYSVAYSRPLAQKYIDALTSEFNLRLPAGARPRTIYVGGGTPTALTAGQLEKLLGLATPVTDTSELEEFTVEANPGTLTNKSIALLRAAGVNRISLGIQSFDDGKLQLLGRVHGAREAKEAFRKLAEAGFDNLGIDLIYGVPGDTQSTWRRDIEQTAELHPQHISTYCLSIEQGTPFAGQLERGELHLPDENLQREFYYHTLEFFTGRGYKHYEISNFALPGCESRHNSATWRYKPYMGFGPAAASFDSHVRTRNPADLDAYFIFPGRPAEAEKLNESAKAAEVMMLGLRMHEGISAADFRGRCGLDLQQTFGERISALEARGLLERVNTAGASYVRLTRDALFVSDEVLSEFF